MRIRMLALLVAVLGLAASPSVAAAHHRHHGHHGRHGHAPRLVPAAVFLPAAASANEFEIVTGGLAQQRAQSTAVRDLGAMFVTDHTALLAKGAQVAQQLGIAAPAQLTPGQQAIVARLEQLSGAAFDAAWLRAQIVAHESALALNLAGAIRGENTAIRTLAQGALPVITNHFGELLDLAAAGSAPHAQR
jgi:putative membrane protein